MQFLLNQNTQLSDLGNINPNHSVLQWLRNNHLTGTKEGCASGDCGACVAVVGELVDGKLVYQSINTCIALALSLQGKHLITVEGLKDKGQLHPVQSAMVEEHGSQCGFCTPGFVMSLFALYQNETQINPEKINHALSGNLCRCTGYQPIIKAAKKSFENKQHDYYQANQATIIKLLQSITKTNHLDFKNETGQFNYQAPESIQELAGILQNNPEANIIAGGTDLSLEITQNLREFKHIVNINNVQELNFIKDDSQQLEVGGAVTFKTAGHSLTTNFPELNDFLTRFASLPIRNVATLAGNIANASPIGDMPPVLLALGAKLNLFSVAGERMIDLEEFYLDYRKTSLQKAEFIKSIIIPKLENDSQLILFKISKRFEDDISAVCLAIKLTMNAGKLTNIKIAFGGMAAIPKRARVLEKMLLSNWQSEDLAQLSYRAIKQEFTPLDDVRATSEYRLQVAANLIEKARLKATRQNDFNLANFDSQQAVNS